MARLAHIGLILDVQKAMHLTRALCEGLALAKPNHPQVKELGALLAAFQSIDDEIDAGLARLAFEAFKERKRARKRGR